jgi:hypothetical protein
VSNNIDVGKISRLWMTMFGDKQVDANIEENEIKLKLDIVVKFFEVANSCTVSQDEYNQTIRILCTKLRIKGMAKGTPVIDPFTYRPWLHQRDDIKPFFWNRYRTYLIETKGWNRGVVDSIGEVNNEILDMIGNPKNVSQWKLRGLALGDVQFGKTSNYTALCNKAMDAGYKVIIVLTGMQENLRQQTQKRLDKELVGFDSQDLLDKIVRKIPIGVGDVDTENFVTTFTSKEYDFDKKIQGSVALRLKDLSGPALFVLKKQKQRLNYLTTWLKKHNKNSEGLIDEAMILIDDEADNASVNTRDGNPTTINKAIRELLASFTRTSYIGYTATPYANIFIDPDTDDKVLKNDLFPSDFIYPLKTPSNYIGSTAIFGDESKYDYMLVEIDDAEEYIPLKHKGVTDINGLPESLYEALRYFLLVNAIMDSGEITTNHRSMLINISRITDVHDHVLQIVMEWLQKMKREVLSYASLEPEEACRITSINTLKKTWEKYKMADFGSIDWITLQQNYLHKSISDVCAIQVNQRTGAASLDYDKFNITGFRVIAIGGDSLSRGLTLEGLCVSYFYRKSRMYDTLLQMGRWFGYRDGYDALCKIWMSDEAIESYSHITKANIELRQELRYMHNNNLTPKDFGLMVRSRPEVVDIIERLKQKKRMKYNLSVTAKNKMKATKEIVRVVSVWGEMIETPKIPINETTLIKNYELVSLFISKIKEYKNNDIEIHDGNHQLWVNVPGTEVADLIRAFSADPLSSIFQPDSLADFIEQAEGLQYWDIAVPEGSASVKEGTWQGIQSVFKSDFKPQLRYIDIDGQKRCLRINGTKQRVGSKPCTMYGLERKKVDEIKLNVEERKKEDEDSNGISDKDFLIPGRKPLLLLHFISMHCKSDNPKIDKVKQDENNKVVQSIQDNLFKKNACLVAIGLGIPHDKNGSRTEKVRYIINKIKQQQLQEEIEEQDYDE